jgi:DNA primase
LAKDRVALTKQVKEANDIVAVIGAYVPLRPQGKAFIGLCPFHNDHRPSFQVDATFQNFRCWACNKAGDVFTFIMEFEKVSFLEARTILANRAGISLQGADGPNVARLRLLNAVRWAAEQYQECLLDSPVAQAAREYLSERRLTGETVRKFGVGYAPLNGNLILSRAAAAGIDFEDLEAVAILGRRESDGSLYERFRDRVMFPVRDARGQVVGFGGRILPNSPLAEKSPKYYNSADTALFNKSELIYGLDLARQAGAGVGYLAVVEGYTDVLMAHQCGVSQVVATMGTSLTPRHVQHLRRFVPRIVLVYDADDGGNTGVDRALEVFVSQSVDLAIARLPDGLDPCDLLIAQGPEPFKRALETAADAFVYKVSQMLTLEDGYGIEGKRRIIDAVLGVLALAPAAADQSVQMKRELTVTHLAQRLGVREETLWARLKELRTERPVTDERPPEKAPAAPELKRKPAAPHERELLELLLSAPLLVPAAMAEIRAEEIGHPGLRQLVEGLYSLQTDGDAPDLDGLRSRVENADLIRYAFDAAEKGRRSSADRDEWLRQIVAAFRAPRDSKAKSELKSQLTAALDFETELGLLRRLKDTGGAGQKPVPPETPPELEV